MENKEHAALLKGLSEIDKLPIASWQYPRILVGIPVERTVNSDHAFWSFMHIASQGPAFIESPYGRVDVVRNDFVKTLLQSSFTHLLMLDSDHVHPRDIIQRLARWVLLFPEMCVISGLNFRRKPPFDPVAGNLTQDTHVRPIMLNWDQGLITADEVGAASLLVHRSVFERIEPWWFFNVYDNPWGNTFPGEDIGFCLKCRQQGITIYVDTTTTSPHITEQLITEETFRNFIATHREDFSDVQHV